MQTKSFFTDENAFEFEYVPQFNSQKQMDFFHFSHAIGTFHGIFDVVQQYSLLSSD